MGAGPLEVWSWIGIDKLPSNKWRAPQDWEEYRQQWLLGLLGFGAASTWAPTWRKLTNWKPVLINGAWTWSATLSWTTGSSLKRKEIFSVCDLMTCQGFLYFHKKSYPFCKTNWPQPNALQCWRNKLEFLRIPVHFVVNGELRPGLKLFKNILVLFVQVKFWFILYLLTFSIWRPVVRHSVHTANLPHSSIYTYLIHIPNMSNIYTYLIHT